MPATREQTLRRQHDRLEAAQTLIGTLRETIPGRLLVGEEHMDDLDSRIESILAQLTRAADAIDQHLMEPA
jgi:hypothetical protein